ncbi:MAG: hypothetical protein HOE90_01945 [Bacteriovoracaceae bacterium]|jgi:hypothetical protein|nr:hypothetical protein [Bacteriovoracaceae bacterium]
MKTWVLVIGLSLVMGSLHAKKVKALYLKGELGQRIAKSKGESECGNYGSSLASYSANSKGAFSVKCKDGTEVDTPITHIRYRKLGRLACRNRNMRFAGLRYSFNSKSNLAGHKVKVYCREGAERYRNIASFDE